MNTLSPTFESFKEFYRDFIIHLKEKIQNLYGLDVQVIGSTRGAAAYFKFLGDRSEVDADSQIDK